MSTGVPPGSSPGEAKPARSRQVVGSKNGAKRLLYLRWCFFALAAIVLIVAVAARTVGVAIDVLYSARSAQWITAVAVSAFVVAIWLGLPRGAHVKVTFGKPTTLLGIAGIVLGAVASANALLPVVPTSATMPTCPTARVRHVPLVAATQDDVGVNGRASPGRNAPQVARFPSGCAIGFDAFCYGEPIVDVAYLGLPETLLRPDVRWLRVARSHGWRHRVAHLLSGEPDFDRFVASARVITQSVSGDLRVLDSSECGDEGQAPTELRFEPIPVDTKPPLRLEASGTRAYDINFAVWLDTNSTGLAFRQVERDRDSGEVLWKSDVTASSLPGPTPVLVAAAACLAPGAEPPNIKGMTAFQWVMLQSNGSVTPIKHKAPPDSVQKTLIRTACQGLP